MKKIISGIMVLASLGCVSQVAVATPKANGVACKRHTVNQQHDRHEQKVDIDRLLREDYKKLNGKTNKVKVRKNKSKDNMVARVPQPKKEREILPSDLLLSGSNETEEEIEEETKGCQQLNLNEEIREEIREENKKCQQTNLKASASLYKLLEADKPCEKNGKKYTSNGERIKGNAGSWTSSLDDILNFSESEDWDLESSNKSGVVAKQVAPKTSKKVQQRNVLKNKKVSRVATDTTSTDFDEFKAAVNDRAKHLKPIQFEETRVGRKNFYLGDYIK